MEMAYTVNGCTETPITHTSPIPMYYPRHYAPQVNHRYGSFRPGSFRIRSSANHRPSDGNLACAGTAPEMDHVILALLGEPCEGAHRHSQLRCVRACRVRSISCAAAAAVAARAPPVREVRRLMSEYMMSDRMLRNDAVVDEN